MYVCVYVCMYVCVCMYMYIMYVCMCVYIMYVCVFWRSRSVQHCEQTAAPLLLGSVCKRSALRGVV